MREIFRACNLLSMWHAYEQKSVTAVNNHKATSYGFMLAGGGHTKEEVADALKTLIWDTGTGVARCMMEIGGGDSTMYGAFDIDDVPDVSISSRLPVTVNGRRITFTVAQTAAPGTSGASRTSTVAPGTPGPSRTSNQRQSMQARFDEAEAEGDAGEQEGASATEAEEEGADGEQTDEQKHADRVDPMTPAVVDRDAAKRAAMLERIKDHILCDSMELLMRVSMGRANGLFEVRDLYLNPVEMLQELRQTRKPDRLHRFQITYESLVSLQIGKTELVSSFKLRFDEALRKIHEVIPGLVPPIDSDARLAMLLHIFASSGNAALKEEIEKLKIAGRMAVTTQMQYDGVSPNQLTAAQREELAHKLTETELWDHLIKEERSRNNSHATALSTKGTGDRGNGRDRKGGRRSTTRKPCIRGHRAGCFSRGKHERRGWDQGGV